MTDQNPPLPQDEEEENEVLRATRELRAQKEAADASEAAGADKGGKRMGWKKAAGIGIGSAAVLAALLYANRDKIK
ncbi:MAG: hypothetical protein U0S50_01335 [Sphingopyxis sp.]|uniref:hypothetical protein n=1 Tax=Sphingopyxis sp. TaxID=1908224 RepID=UPI002AB97716|nr:hypothetical protein [Sphingopyxis sp.]MDZ3830443.1 hypothetical protein [Sphingopyxis sp.]